MKDNKDQIAIESICDNLIDQNHVQQAKRHHMLEAFEGYKKINMLLGYFSQLRDFGAEYESLTIKVFTHRKEILIQYKDILTDDFNDIFKQILMSPTKTEWYRQGINKYKKVKNYSMYYYRRKLYIELENETLDMINIKRIIETVISLDKYYDIYEETINFFMRTSDRFEKMIKKHFPEYIHL